jgi:hypothetical protein
MQFPPIMARQLFRMLFGAAGILTWLISYYPEGHVATSVRTVRTALGDLAGYHTY